MSKEGKNALSKLKQKVRKLLEDLSEQVENYKKNPVMTEESKTSSEESESEEEEVKEKSGSESSSRSSSRSSASSKSSKSDNESDDEWDKKSEEGEGVLNLNNMANMTREERRKLWLKAPDDPSLKANKPVDKATKREQKRDATERVYKIQEINQDFSNIDVSDESINRRLNEIASSRSQ